MRRILRYALERMAGALLRLGRMAWRNPDELRVAAWFADQGDATLRLDYDLGPQSLVFDLGGYEGQWASDIHAMYGCRVFVFEPVPAFAARIGRRFRHNPNIRVFDFGLAGRTGEAGISLAQDASSLYHAGSDAIRIQLLCAADFLRDEGVTDIDLMKINIEGGEYDLLEHLLDTGLAGRIGNLQVQFHDFVPDARSRMEAIQQRLAATHELTYQYPFVWENWRRRA